MFKETYQAAFSKVTASEDTYRRVMNMTNPKKRRRTRGFAGKALIAAVIVTALAATAGAAGFGWFTTFFGGSEALSPDQLQYLEENTQTMPPSSDGDPVNEAGYAVSVDSIITDGSGVMVALNITMPEQLEAPGEGWVMESGPRTRDLWLCPADQRKPAIEELIRWSGTSRVYDDGDGRDNTCVLILSITRDGPESLTSLADEWTLHIGGLEATWHNPQKEAEIKGQYAGQDHIIDGEEAARFLRFESLCDDTWEFTLNLNTDQDGAVEFVAQPVTLSGYRHATLDELRQGFQADIVGPYEVRLVSLRISPLSYYLQYSAEDAFHAQAVDVGGHTLVMKDGTKIGLTQYSGRHTFDQPILPEEIDYILLSNGVMLTAAQ